MKSIHSTFRAVLLSLCLMLALFTGPARAASLVYDSYLYDVFTGAVVSTDTYKCALVTSSYTENRVTHTRFSDITNEVSGTGYTAGGVTVVPTFTKDTTNHRLTVVFPQVTLPSSTITARKAVCYKSTGTASTSPLVFVNDFGADVTTSNGTFTLNASTIHFNAP